MVLRSLPLTTKRRRRGRRSPRSPAGRSTSLNKGGFSLKETLISFIKQLLTGSSIQFFYLMGKMLAKYPKKRRKEVESEIREWFSRYRYPWFRGKRRLGVIQNTSILGPDMK